MKVSDKEFLDIIEQSNSIAETLRKMNLVPRGGNYQTINVRIKRLNADTSHFKGQGWNIGRKVPRQINLEDKLVKGKATNSDNLKKQLIAEGVFERKCYGCGRTEWERGILPLELDHIDGDKLNNLLENLKILCANCHGQTPTYRGKNIGRGKVAELAYAEGLNPSSKERNLDAGSNPVFPTVNHCKCGKIIKPVAVTCRSCVPKKQRIQWPSPEVLIQRVQDIGYSALGRELGVSDNAIRKHLRGYGIIS